MSLMPSADVWAQNRVWNNAGTGSWNFSGNWTPAGPPGSTADADINNGGTALLTGDSGLARDLYIGRDALDVGHLRLFNAGTLNSRLGTIGHYGEGEVVVGDDFAWTMTDALTIGRFGDGVLSIESGATVTNSFGSYIGREEGSTGVVGLSSNLAAGLAKWNTGSLYVGRDGEGTLDVFLYSEVTTSGSSIIGDLPGSVGDAYVGVGSLWQTTQSLTVGDEGKGDLRIVEGVVKSANGRVGIFNGSRGVVIIESSGLWELTSALDVGSFGSGEVRILGSSDVSSNGGNIGGSATSDAEVRLNDGTWTNSGRLSVHSGGVMLLQNGSTLTSTWGIIDGADIDLRGNVTLNEDSIWTNSAPDPSTGQSLIIGNSGYGKLSINESTVKSTTGMMGYYNTSDAEVFVRGDDALWENTGRLTVGGDGDADLTITEGGRVTSYTAIIADNATSQSRVIVEGTDSLWQVTGIGTVGGGFGALVVGDTNGAGTEGTLLVRDGGVVMSSGPAPSPLSGNVHIQGKGKLMGDGTVIGKVFNSATVAPGYVHEITDVEVRGTLHISGDYTQGGGRLQIELGADAHDKLDVSGAFGLSCSNWFYSACNLEVTLDEGFVPTIGQSFDIIDWGSANLGFDSSNSFSTGFLPALPGGRVWDLSQLHSAGVIAVGGTSTVMGDYNGNGAVDAADYIPWRKHIGTPAGYGVWRNGYGSNGGTGAGAGQAGGLDAAVPEPSAALLMFLAMFGFLSASARFAPRNLTPCGVVRPAAGAQNYGELCASRQFS